MKKNYFKIASVIIMVLWLSMSYVFATDIDLNLPATNDTTTEATENFVSENENVIAENNSFNDISDVDDRFDTTLHPTATSTSSASSQNGLSISDIINILLITVGVILILLAIAIIIRLK